MVEKWSQDWGCGLFLPDRCNVVAGNGVNRTGPGSRSHL
jgi:hypothetical protein